MTIHTNGTALRVLVKGVRLPPLLEAPGFELEARDGGLDVRGTAAPEQVLRLLARRWDVDRSAGDRVEVRIETSGGRDEYVYTADMEHRLMFRREWERGGRRAVLYGLNPFVGDTEGPVEKVPGRATLRNVVGILSKDGPLARLDVMNLFTFRSPDAATLPARPADRVAVPELERQVLSEADVVLLAWGSKVEGRHRRHVEDFLDRLHEVGSTPWMLARDGKLLTAGSPPQPAHPSRLGWRRVDAVPVDRDTVLSGHRG